MVYGFIKQSNGHVSIYSELGHGTTVKLFLPRRDGVPEQQAKQDKAPVPGGHDRILVVEDEPQVRGKVVRQLRSLGYTVSEASDGAAGIASFESGIAAIRPVAERRRDARSHRRQASGRRGHRVAGPAPRSSSCRGSRRSPSVRHGQLDEGALLLSKPFRKADLARMIRHALDSADRPAGVPALSK